MRERGAGFYHGLAIAAVVIWGTTFVSTKVLLTEGLSPAAIMFLRFLIAYAVLRTVCPRNEHPVRFKDELMFAAAGITGGSMYFLTENKPLSSSADSISCQYKATLSVFCGMFGVSMPTAVRRLVELGYMKFRKEVTA